MKKVYFVRHGATKNNHANLFQDENTELSELGLGQAEYVANRFKTINIETIISSSMKRAVQTAEAISKTKEMSIIKSNLFIENLKPQLVRNKSKDDPEAKEVMKLVKKNFDNPDWKHSNEENFFDLIERAKTALDFIQQRNEEKILIVTHGQFLTFFIGYLLFGSDFTPKEFKRMEKTFIAKNTGLSIMEILEDKNLLITWNDHAHLGDLDII